MATTSTIDKAAAANRCNLVMIGLLIWWTPDPFRILNARRGRVRRSRQCFTLSRQCFRRSRQCFRRSEQSLGIALSALFRNPSDTDIERPSLMDKASSNGWMKLHLRTRANHCPSGTNSCLSSTLDKTWLSARNASSTWAKNLSSSHPGHPSSSSPGHSSSSHPGHPRPALRDILHPAARDIRCPADTDFGNSAVRDTQTAQITPKSSSIHPRLQRQETLLLGYEA